MSTGYMSVGEVADLVGVTVRSIQYYDQQGILSPSAKGPQNQRLYTPDDVERLYCVLCLKYAGLSLAQIKGCLEGGVTRSAARQVFLDALHKTEDSFSTLLSRYATLRALVEGLEGCGSCSSEAAAAPSDVPGDPDWAGLARSIESFQDDGKYFWRLSCVYDEDAPESEAGAFDKGRVVTAWHGLIAEVIINMREREPLDSPKSQELARRYLALRAEDARRPSGQSFLLLENAPASHHPGGESFDVMRRGVNEYLADLVGRYSSLHPDGCAGGRGVDCRPDGDADRA